MRFRLVQCPLISEVIRYVVGIHTCSYYQTAKLYQQLQGSKQVNIRDTFLCSLFYWEIYGPELVKVCAHTDLPSKRHEGCFCNLVVCRK